MRVLCFDIGSSSLKFSLYTLTKDAAELEAGDTVPYEHARDIDAAVEEIFKKTPQLVGGLPDAIGHRIVFGGQYFAAPVVVVDSVMDDLESLIRFDPLHMSPQIGAVRALREKCPAVPQVLCFDSSFHRRMPERARRLPLPLSLGPELQRYGFHGLSYEFVVSTEEDARHGKVVVAHLGSGASMCALLDGHSIDTTMGFSPLGGLIMGTRPGDLDPGVLLHLVRQGWDANALSDLLYLRSGLQAISESTSDVRELLRHSAVDTHAALALELFVYQASKQLGAMIASLSGLDTLIFTGGIGEGSPEIRMRICQPFAFAALEIDQAHNLASRPTISSDVSAVRVRIVRTNENLMIARHVRSMLPDGAAVD